MKRTLLFPLLASSLLVQGCNLAPHYVRTTGEIPPQFSQGSQPATSTAVPDPTAIAWRDFFLDDRLRSVIALGLENNRDLRVALANIEAARAQYRIQRSDLLPSVDGGASATYQRSTASGAGINGGGGILGGDRDTHGFSASVGFSSYEIDLFGRVRNLSKAALEQYLATESAQRATRISLIAEIANAWLTLAADRSQLSLSNKTLEAYRATLALTKAQFASGTISELEVHQAQTNFDQARYDIATLTTQIAQDRNALDLLAGLTLDEKLLPDGLSEKPFTLDTMPGDLSSTVLLRRPDVDEAEHKLMAQNANIGAARAAFFPTISLTTALGTISGGLSNLFSSGTQAWSVAPSATLPIFDFGRNQANLRLAKAERDAALATYEKTVQTAFREVEDALAQRRTMDEQIAARQSRAEAASKAAFLADARYRAGVENFQTTLDSERTAYAAQKDLTSVRLARASNLVELYRALGGGLAAATDVTAVRDRGAPPRFDLPLSPRANTRE